MACGPGGTALVVAISVGVTVMLLALNMSTELGGYGAGKIFAYHPVFMCIAFLLLIPLGLISYVGDFGERGNAAFPDKESRRLVHGVLTIIAAFLIVTGYLVAFVYHEAKGIEHLALTDNQGTWTRPAHVFIGLIALGGAALQASAGLYKFVAATRDRAAVLRVHGTLGPVVWIAGLLCVCLAAWFEYLEGAGHWTIGQATAIWLGVAALAGAVLALMRFGTRNHVMAGDGATDAFLKRGNLLLQ